MSNSLPRVPQWRPERVVDERLARLLIRDRYPELAAGEMRLLGEGWDSTVWLVDGRLVFRFPRREVVVPGLLRELAALPVLAPQLPLPIPVATHRGQPAHGFPWPWAGSPFLPGREIADARPSQHDRVRHGSALGAFLRALHDIDPATVLGGQLPVDPIRRADMPYRVEALQGRLATLAAHDLWQAPSGLTGELDAAVQLPPPSRLCVTHGDLHLRHLLIDDGELSGVIDWIDVARADPGVDLPLYWAYLPPAGRLAFHDMYGQPTADQLLRGRVLAVFLWGTLADYARDVGMGPLLAEALAGLDLATADLR
jgi:aminoglycoside phosphotransferase (APT) family kinase protein